MDDIRLEKRTIQERLIIAKTLIETALSDLPTAEPELANNSPKVENENGDLIRRQDAIDALGDMPMSWADTDAEIQAQEDWKQHREALLKLPTAEPRKGKWIDGFDNGFDEARHWFRECSECGFARKDDNSDLDSNYCPNCGAKMDGGEHGFN